MIARTPAPTMVASGSSELQRCSILQASNCRPSNVLACCERTCGRGVAAPNIRPSIDGTPEEKFGNMTEELEDKTFLLPAEVQFGYLPIPSSHIEVRASLYRVIGLVPSYPVSRVRLPKTISLRRRKTPAQRTPMASCMARGL